MGRVGWAYRRGASRNGSISISWLVRGAALTVALLAMLGIIACSSVSSSSSNDERLGEAQQAINGGTLDTTGQFPAVVAVLLDTPGGACDGGCTAVGLATGVALSDRVVATAGHLAGYLGTGAITTGCEGFTYAQADSPTSQATTRLWVQTADANGNAAPPNPDPANQYGVDGVIGRRQVAPLNAYDCCGGDPNACAECNNVANNEAANWLLPFDFELLHLDRPLQNVTPMDFVARVGPTDAAKRTYPIDPAAWPYSVQATIVGVGNDDEVNGVFGQRKYGLNTVIGLGYTFNNIYAPGSCDVNSTLNYSCDDCIITITGRSMDPLLYPNGPDRMPGDSGAPLIVNDTAHGGTAIPGLPPNRPFVIGFGDFGTCPGLTCTYDALGNWIPGDDHSVVAWDAKLGGNSVGTGTFIESHLVDWDQDGVPDNVDNCPLAPNPDQANCNKDAEDARGFPNLGDACDPIPCATASPTGSASLMGAWDLNDPYIYMFNGVSVQDRMNVEPHGSHYFSSGAQNHRPLPELAVGDVSTYYRFCQPDAANLVVCNNTVAGHNEYLFASPKPFPSPTRPWLPTSMWTTGDPPISLTDHESLAHPSGSVERRWDYATDYNSWATQGWISLPAGCSLPDGCCDGFGVCTTGLDGRFWTRSNTTAGTASNPVLGPINPFAPSWLIFAPPNTGFHPQNGATSSLDVHLSNDYMPLLPDQAVFYTVGKPVFQWPYFRWRWWSPDPMRPVGWVGTLRQDAVVMPLAYGHVGLLGPDGNAVVADALVGRELKAALQDTSIRWVEAVEPALNIASATFDSAVNLVGLASDGTAITQLMLRQGSSQCTPPSADKMSGWWPMDGDAHDRVPLAPAHEGRFTGPVASVSGMVGQAASFPWPADVRGAKSYMTVGNEDGAFDLANDFTVEAWVYPMNPFRSEQQDIIARGSSAAWRLGIQAVDGTLYAVKGGTVITTPVTLASQQWQHVAVSFTAGGTVFYVDGQVAYTDTSTAGTADITYDPSSLDQPVLCGAGFDSLGNPGGARSFDGRLDEVSVYHQALSSAEIAAVFNAGGAGKCKPPAVIVPPPPGHGGAPAPRQAYTTVFSRAENALFVLGGRDLATNAPLQDIWMQKVDPGGTWVLVVPASYAPGEILDATWSYADHRLWVLDSRTIDGSTVIRLVRIEPYLGTTQVLGQWGADSSIISRWLALDRDGQVLLVASSAYKHGVTRIGVVPFEDALPPQVSLAVRTGRLAFRPVVDGDGYSFFLTSGSNLSIDRATQLDLAPAALGAYETALGGP